MKIFAIGFKNWIELRSYKSAPVPEVDESVIMTKEKEYYYDVNGHPKSRTIDHPWKIKTVHYPGGKVIYTLKSNKLKYLGVYVGDQKCVELNKDQLKGLIINGGLDKLNKFVN